MRSMTEPCEFKCGEWDLFWLQTCLECSCKREDHDYDTGNCNECECEEFDGFDVEEDFKKTIPQINYKQVEFSDGTILFVPFDTNETIHVCPTLHQYQEAGNEVYDTEWHHNLVDKIENASIDLYYSLDRNLQIFTKTDRSYLRQGLISFLNDFFILDVDWGIRDLMKIITTDEFPWFKKYSGSSQASALEILAFLFHMDSLWADAKKCLELQKAFFVTMEVKDDEGKSIKINCRDLWSKQIENYNKLIEESKQIERSSLSDNDDIETFGAHIIQKFENGTLEKYIQTIFTREELTRILKETPERWLKTSDGWRPSESSLLDKARTFQRKEEKDKPPPMKDPKDLDFLDFADKIAIIHTKFHGKKLDNGKWEKNAEQQEIDLIKKLHRIRILRNAIEHRAGKFRKEELSSEKEQVAIYMKWCNEFFKKNPGK